MGTAVAKGHCQTRDKATRSREILPKGLKGEAAVTPANYSHTGMAPIVVSVSTYVFKEDRSLAIY